jgi:putative tryptophan/tyrosine transport system substrate-binding protein
MTPGTSPPRRRVLAAAGTLLLPRAAGAQTARRRRIGYLSPGSSGPSFLGAFRQGFRALGYADEDIAIEERYADGQAERLPDLAVELVQLNPEVILTTANLAIRAAKQATSTIPIVMANSGDPVGLGFVASLAHPGGNVSGLSSVVSYEIAGKWLQLLKTAIPGAERVAILVNPGNPQHLPMLQVARAAARTLRAELFSVEVRAIEEIDGAFAAMARERAQALIVPGEPMFLGEKSRIVEFAASHKLPAIYSAREFTAIGGLMSYGADLKDNFRRAASYVDKILKGAKPADLPVEQPTKFQLVVNLKTAQALGLTIPPLILAGADEVIE